jgi:hypothetical protein
MLMKQAFICIKSETHHRVVAWRKFANEVIAQCQWRRKAKQVVEMGRYKQYSILVRR